MSLEERKALLEIARESRAKASTQDYIEYVWAEHLAENNHGFLPEHLLQIINFVEGCIRDGVNGVVLAPRGSSKTTGITQGWLSKKIADNPNIRVGLFSNTDRQAWAFSGAIRSCFESNDRFIGLYGDVVSRKKWTDAEWLHKDSVHHRSKDRTVYAGGVGAPIVSKRFDLVLLDDILDKENTANPDQILKTTEWFDLVLRPCLTPKGVTIYIGTRWAEGDMAEQLITEVRKGGKGWRFLLIKALQDEESGEPKSYWPDRWPVEKLLLERSPEGMGAAMFSVAYQNDISAMLKGNIFKPLKDEYYFVDLPRDRHYTIRMGIDLAASIRETADYTARVITAEDDEGEFWVLTTYRDRRESHHAEFIADGYMAYPGISLVVAENNAFQATLIQEVLRVYPEIPIVGRKTDVDKTQRARTVALKYEAHKVHHHISLKGGELEREELAFKGDGSGHDDLIDALGFSMELTGGSFFFGSVSRSGMRLHGAAR